MCTSATMLTNEYLRPEYLPPVSGSFDVNKSPLALLAKTCSNIGVENPSIKSLTTSSSLSSSSSSSNSSSSASSINSNEHRRSTPKSKTNNNNNNNTDSNNSNEMSKLNFKPYELSHNKPSNGKFSDKDKMRSSPGKNTPVSSASGHPNKAQVSSSPGANQNSSDGHKQSQQQQHQSNNNSNHNSSAPLSYTSLGLPDMHKDSLAAFYKAYGFLSPNCCPTSTASPYGGLMPPPITLDKTGAYPSIYPPTASATAAATIAAYNYARLKGNMGMMPGASNPLCRDPYCGGACGQFGSMHNSHAALLAASSAGMYRESNAAAAAAAANQPVPGTTCTPATCPNGCSQCEHHRYLAAITAAAYGNSFPGFNPGAYPQSVSASYASSLAAAAALHHRTASAAGNVCNWIIGDVQCGKRFSTSEELLQHLKTHTVPLQQQQQQQHTSESNTTSSSSTSTSVPSPAHHYTSSSISPNSPASQQHHPGTHSPLSHSAKLSASSASPTPGSHSISHAHHAANRFHPYSKPAASSVTQSLPPSAHLTSNPFSGMGYHVPTSGAPSFPSAQHQYAAALSQSAAAASMPSFAASNLYYPYMTPNFFSGRIGPPVPP